jgi:hypothetical protein
LTGFHAGSTSPRALLHALLQTPKPNTLCPASRKRSIEPITPFAADRNSAEALVALFRKFRDMPESCRDKVSFQSDTILAAERYPQTRKTLIREEHFANLGAEELRYVINEMFARHGAYFGREDVLAMFEGFDWYRPMITITFDRIEAGFFSEHERENLRILGRLRASKSK